MAIAFITRIIIITTAIEEDSIIVIIMQYYYYLLYQQLAVPSAIMEFIMLALLFLAEVFINVIIIGQAIDLMVFLQYYSTTISFCIPQFLTIVITTITLKFYCWPS